MNQEYEPSEMDALAEESAAYERFEGQLKGETASSGGKGTPAADNEPSGFCYELYEWVEQLTLALLLVVLLFTFVCRTVTVDGESMFGTLKHGDSLFVTRLAGDPKPGDIVAVTKLESANKPLIKRVIAVEGQTLDIDGATGEVYVDGQMMSEPYIAEKITPNDYYDMAFPIEIPPGCIFVMGDNRNHSWDSRAEGLGSIDTRHVLGKVIWRYFPFDQFGNPE